MPENILQTILELWQARCHDWYPGEPLQVPVQPFSEEPFPNTEPETPLSQLHAVPSGPAACQSALLRGSCRLPLSLLFSRLKYTEANFKG